ncbi:hypothetical protein [Clostridium gasigenes]|uniref:hypothetical protein n=1 Tax=Clostridium gasigenes TaxID=94869 RepID=UPI001C0AD45D|nr:hypothetical protein [Clostridium gasigenes]MBU3103019.1 hypothetical protein [Clostridium gasigenes]MBU3131619.1 hypothetical protein [Clostridium gasigenes]
METIKNDIVNGITEGLKTKFVEGFKWLSITIIDSSYIICLSVAMVGLLFYLSGYKKGAKVVTISLITFFVLQAIKGLYI